LQNHKGETIQVESFVAVAYDDQYFVGQVTNITRNVMTVKFLKRGTNGYYIWPRRNDIAEVDLKFIFSASVQFEGRGLDKNGVGFIVDEDDLQEQYEAYKNDYMSGW